MGSLGTFTIVACGVIIISFVAAWIYISQADSDKLTQNRIWINQLPTIISTLGVLGTFVGITIGLLGFDASNLTNSIPILLNGLKTAFFTSLCGMVGSLFLSRVVSHKFDMEESKSETEKAADAIIKALDRNNRDVISKINKLNENFSPSVDENGRKSGICQAVGQLRDDVEEIKGLMEEIRNSLGDIQNTNASCATEIPRLRAVMVTATASVSAMDNNIAEMNDEVGLIQQTINDIKEVIEES